MSPSLQALRRNNQHHENASASTPTKPVSGAGPESRNASAAAKIGPLLLHAIAACARAEGRTVSSLVEGGRKTESSKARIVIQVVCATMNGLNEELTMLFVRPAARAGFSF